MMSAHAAMLAARNHLLGNALSSLVVLAVIVAAPKDADAGIAASPCDDGRVFPVRDLPAVELHAAAR